MAYHIVARSLFNLVWLLTATSSWSWLRVIDVSHQLTPYATALDWQRQLMDHHIAQQDKKHHDCAGSILCVQHPHVYTLGSGTVVSTSGPFSRFDSTSGKELTFETVQVDRGGQATYHGPGQLVFYPILDLHFFEKDIHGYLRKLEEVVINLFGKFGIDTAHTIPGLTGVWVTDLATRQEYKLAAIGIKLRRWVTMHGVAVNVNSDLRYFGNIIPCGITDKRVGNMQQFSPISKVEISSVASTLIPVIEEAFNVPCRKLNTIEDITGMDPSVAEEILSSSSINS